MKRRRFYLKTFIVLIVLGVGIHIYNMDVFSPEPNPSSPLVIAHRGASGIAPENTLVAIREAMKMEVDFIEIDVHQTKDNRIAVMHDATLDRTTNGTGAISDYTLAELKQLDAGSWKGSQFANERIPTLEEVLSLVEGKTRLLIEVKQGEKDRYPRIEEKILALIEKDSAASWVVIQSFQAETVKRFRELAPALEIHKLLLGELPLIPLHHDGDFQFKQAGNFKGAQAINPWFTMLTQRLVNRIHRRGKKVFVFTINEIPDMEKAIKMGVDGIITNYPDRLIQIKNRPGVREN